MIELGTLTNPGPFAEHTFELEHYDRRFSSGELVGMAGQGMPEFNFAGISAVCTHPDHLGKG